MYKIRIKKSSVSYRISSVLVRSLMISPNIYVFDIFFITFPVTHTNTDKIEFSGWKKIEVIHGHVSDINYLTWSCRNCILSLYFSITKSIHFITRVLKYLIYHSFSLFSVLKETEGFITITYTEHILKDSFMQNNMNSLGKEKHFPWYYSSPHTQDKK